MPSPAGSLSGGIATRHAIRHPEPVDALIVIDSTSAAGLPLSVDNLIMRARSIKFTLDGGMDAMVSAWCRHGPVGMVLDGTVVPG